MWPFPWPVWHFYPALIHFESNAVSLSSASRSTLPCRIRTFLQFNLSLLYA